MVIWRIYVPYELIDITQPYTYTYSYYTDDTDIIWHYLLFFMRRPRQLSTMLRLLSCRHTGTGCYITR